MNGRFEIPIPPRGYNMFLIDDYLRTIRSHEERVKLINTYGFSAEKRGEYERAHSLPHGAVELALLCEDRQLNELNSYINNTMNGLYERKASPEEINEALTDFASRSGGIRTLYPDAFQFLVQYSSMARRNASAFRGDYRFNNEYKLMRIDCSPTANAQTCSPVNYCVSINYVVALNVAVEAYVVAALALVLAFVYWVWALVFVIP